MSEMDFDSNLAHPGGLKVFPSPMLDSVKGKEPVTVPEAFGALHSFPVAIPTPPGDLPCLA
jgi:hypothetical protein